MATEEKDKGEGDGAPKKSKKKLFIILGVVLVLVLGGVGAFFALSGGKKAAAGEEGEEGGEEHGSGGGEHGEGGHGEKGDLPGAIIPLDPFIVNLQVKGSFLKTTIQLEFGEPAQPHTFENDLPKVRDSIIRLLSAKSAQDILSAEGKEKLREEVKEGVNNALGSEDVVNVYFTEFIVQ